MGTNRDIHGFRRSLIPRHGESPNALPRVARAAYRLPCAAVEAPEILTVPVSHINRTLRFPRAPSEGPL